MKYNYNYMKATIKRFIKAHYEPETETAEEFINYAEAELMNKLTTEDYKTAANYIGLNADFYLPFLQEYSDLAEYEIHNMITRKEYISLHNEIVARLITVTLEHEIR